MKSCHMRERDGPKGILVSEVSQTSKKQIHGFAYMCNLKNKMNNQIKTETHKYRELVVSREKV